MENNLEACANEDLTGRTLAIVQNNADDGAGGASCKDAGMWVGRRIHDAFNGTRMCLRDVGAVNFEDDESGESDPRAKKLHQIVSSTEEGADHIQQALERGELVLSLGGNHVRGLDVIGALRYCHEQGIELGLVWVDAHPDANTPESSLTGDIHGMVSAVLMGRGPKELLDLLKGAPFIKPENVIYVGLNAIDHPRGKEHTELTYLRELMQKGTRCFTMRDMKASPSENVIPQDVSEAILNLGQRLKAKGGKVWVELDVDVFCKKDMPAAVMDNPEGMRTEQGYDLFRQIGLHLPVIGMGVSKLSPIKDTDDQQSATVVATCVASTFGVRNIPYSLQMHGIPERPNTFAPDYDPHRQAITIGTRYFYPEPDCEYVRKGGGMYEIFIVKEGKVIGIKAGSESVPDLHIGTRVFSQRHGCYGTIEQIVIPYTEGRTDDVLDIRLEDGRFAYLVKITEVRDPRR